MVIESRETRAVSSMPADFLVDILIPIIQLMDWIRDQIVH